MKAKKAIVALGCAGLLVAGSVAGTLAYLTANTGVVTNTFTVGSVAIDLDEADVNVYGELLKKVAEGQPEEVWKPADGEDQKADRVVSNDYKLIPSHTYVKDPTVHVTKGSEESYVFVKVVNPITSIEATTTTTIADQMTSKGWKALTGEENVFVYDTTDDDIVGSIVDAREAAKDLVIFESFTIKPDADLADMAGKTITIDAYAVQADGFADATAAWNGAKVTWEN